MSKTRPISYLAAGMLAIFMGSDATSTHRAEDAES